MSLKVSGHATYNAKLLDPNSFPSTPLPLFRQWYQEAVDHPCAEPEAIAFSTASISAIPSVRFVLLKEVDERGFVIYTNYQSRKGREMEENPHASLAAYWGEMHRSVRVVGRIERVDQETTQAYYASRPLGSRVGAWASPQSQVIPDREALESLVGEVEKRFGIDKEVAKEGENGPGGEAETPEKALECPPYWGGIRLIPDEIEFWAGQPSRLHDRLIYRRTSEPDEKGEGTWSLQRLAP